MRQLRCSPGRGLVVRFYRYWAARKDRDDFIDRPFEGWARSRPGFDDGAADLIVEAVKRQTGLEGLDDFGWRHQR